MEHAKHKVLYGSFGATVGLAGMTLASRCAGGCMACFGCAVPGIGIVLLWAIKRRRKHGMAQAHG